MKTLMTLMVILGSINAMAYSKKAEYNFVDGAICSDRSVGKGEAAGESEESVVIDTESSDVITN